jgi:hypothetical protein
MKGLMIYNSAIPFLQGRAFRLVYGNRLFIEEAKNIIACLLAEEDLDVDGQYILERVYEHLDLQLRSN